MTHDKDVDYEEYVIALKGNPIARAVKMADVEHNANESRNALADVSEKKREHWRRKYARAREILEG